MVLRTIGKQAQDTNAGQEIIAATIAEESFFFFFSKVLATYAATNGKC